MDARDAETGGETRSMKGEVRGIAVLFTDIVGSTRYFTLHGDAQGRWMLEAHQRIAEKGVTDHNGIPVKTIGDALLAYFFDPADAVRAAVVIQQSFHAHNLAHPDPKERIRVRIGLHFGEGIVERNDIFGNVVNLAAKITPLAGAEQILASETVYDLSQSFVSVPFIPFTPPPDRPAELRGLSLYEISWHEDFQMSVANQPLLYLHPLTGIMTEETRAAWRDLMEEIASSDDPVLLRTRIFEDGSAALLFKEIAHGVSHGIELVERIKKRLSQTDPGLLVPPFLLLVDLGKFLTLHGISLRDLSAEIRDMEPGRLHVTGRANRQLQKTTHYAASPVPDHHPDRPLFRIDESDPLPSQEMAFHRHMALAWGEHPPCFYCGTRRHAAGACPSRRFEEAPRHLPELSRRSPLELDALFSGPPDEWDRLAVQEDDRRLPDGDRRLAAKSLFDGSAIFQFRFFKTLWDAPERATWSDMRQWPRHRSRGGGPAWLALDCLRIGDVDRAARLIGAAGESQPENFHFHCVRGFVALDRGDAVEARMAFEAAKPHARTVLQNMIVRFYLSRLSLFHGGIALADHYLTEISRMEPQCPEAQYQRIILGLNKGERERAVSRLVRFVRSHPEYFMTCFLDPDMAPFQRITQPLLLPLLEDARSHAGKALREVMEAYMGVIRLAGEKEPAARDLVYLHGRLTECAGQGGYTSQLETARLVDRFLREHLRIRHALDLKVYHGLQARKIRIHELLEQARRRHPKAIPAITRMQSAIAELHRLADTREPGSYRKVLDSLQRMSRHMDGLERHFGDRGPLAAARRFLRRLLPRAALLVAGGVLAGFSFPPLMVFLLGAMGSGLGISIQATWEWQRILMTLGAVLGVAGGALWTALTTRRR